MHIDPRFLSYLCIFQIGHSVAVWLLVKKINYEQKAVNQRVIIAIFI